MKKVPEYEGRLLRKMLNEYKNQHDLQSNELAQKLNVSESYLSEILSHKRNSSINVAKKVLSIILGKTIDDHEILDEIKQSGASCTPTDDYEPLSKEASKELAMNDHLYNLLITVGEKSEGVKKEYIQTYYGLFGLQDLEKLCKLGVVAYNEKTDCYTTELSKFCLDSIDEYVRAGKLTEKFIDYTVLNKSEIGFVFNWNESLTRDGIIFVENFLKKNLMDILKTAEIEHKKPLIDGGYRINFTLSFVNRSLESKEGKK